MKKLSAQELRIGNYHYYTVEDSEDERKKWDEVCQIEAEDFPHIDNDDSYKPIPLTEEWLFKFGNVKKTKVIQVLEVFERFGFIWKDEYGYWYVVTKSGDYLTKIEFVHEYQNFIFSSTGTELVVKSDSL